MNKVCNIWKVAQTAVIVLSLTSCAGDNSSFKEQTVKDQRAVALQNADSRPDITSSDYRIAPQDTLEVTVFQVPDLSRVVLVNGSGSISYPLIGRVDVGGKTTDQAQQEIAAKLAKSYLRSPQVSVTVKKSGQKVTINGAIGRPSVLTIEGRLTLSQAIAQAGGLSDLGNAERVHVARLEGQTVKDSILNLDAIQAGKEPDPALNGGDIVVVEESNTRIAFKTMKDILPFAAIATILSDRRVKHDVVLLGLLENGLHLYRYRYAWSDRVYVGVMAQEVRRIRPDAVVAGDDGYLHVNYGRLGLTFQTWDDWLSVCLKDSKIPVCRAAPVGRRSSRG